MDSTFCTPSGVSIWTITKMLSFAAVKYSVAPMPQMLEQIGLPKPLLPRGGNRLSATTSLAFSAVPTCHSIIYGTNMDVMKRVQYHRNNDPSRAGVQCILDLPSCPRVGARRWNPHKWTRRIGADPRDGLHRLGCTRLKRGHSVLAIYQNP